MASWQDSGTYLRQQRLRLPNHMFRRLHLCEGGLPEGAAFDLEMIEAAIERGTKTRSAVDGITYEAFVDMSGGSSDDATLAIAHVDDRKPGHSRLGYQSGPEVSV